ncbi:unnamed protein product, partial [Prorocentrum cordatum]
SFLSLEQFGVRRPLRGRPTGMPGRRSLPNPRRVRAREAGAAEAGVAYPRSQALARLVSREEYCEVLCPAADDLSHYGAKCLVELDRGLAASGSLRLLRLSPATCSPKHHVVVVERTPREAGAALTDPPQAIAVITMTLTVCTATAGTRRVGRAARAARAAGALWGRARLEFETGPAAPAAAAEMAPLPPPRGRAAAGPAGAPEGGCHPPSSLSKCPKHPTNRKVKHQDKQYEGPEDMRREAQARGGSRSVEGQRGRRAQSAGRGRRRRGGVGPGLVPNPGDGPRKHCFEEPLSDLRVAGDGQFGFPEPKIDHPAAAERTERQADPGPVGAKEPECLAGVGVEPAGGSQLKGLLLRERAPVSTRREPAAEAGATGVSAGCWGWCCAGAAGKETDDEGGPMGRQEQADEGGSGGEGSTGAAGGGPDDGGGQHGRPEQAGAGGRGWGAGIPSDAGGGPEEDAAGPPRGGGAAGGLRHGGVACDAGARPGLAPAEPLELPPAAPAAQRRLAARRASAAPCAEPPYTATKASATKGKAPKTGGGGTGAAAGSAGTRPGAMADSRLEQTGAPLGISFEHTGKLFGLSLLLGLG